MNFTCSRSLLVEVVNNVQRSVSQKSTIPALEGILIRVSSDEIFFCGYNMELGLTAVMPADVQETGSIVVSAKIFSDIIRRLPNDSVNIFADEKNVMTIISGESNFTITGISTEEFPELPNVMDEQSFVMEQKVLKSMIRQTIFAIAENDSKPIHTGSLFELSEGMIRLVSVDGYRLAVREEKIRNEKEMNFVVPGKTLQELLKLLKDEEDDQVTVYVSSRNIQFELDRYTLVSRLLEGEFLDYHSALPKEQKTEVRVNVSSFVSSVERVSLIISDRLKSPIRCTFEEGSIRLFCFTPIGRANDRLEASIKGDNLEIGFNSRFLTEALKNTETDEVRIILNGANSPMVILPPEGDSFLFLVLPVRLNADY